MLYKFFDLCVQKSLISGNNTVTSSKATGWSNWKRTYQPGLGWGGVGNKYINNRLLGGPHTGIFGGGMYRGRSMNL